MHYFYSKLKQVLPLFLGMLIVCSATNLAAQSSWQLLGSHNFSAGTCWTPTIALNSSGTPFVVYQDGANSNKATVKQFNGTSWTTVGSAGFSAGAAYATSIAFDGSGTPYVAFQDAANSDKVTVMKFNGVNWVTVGSAGFSAGVANKPSIGINGSGTPYVAYQDEAYSYKATVMKFDGANWVAVGSAGFSASGVNDPSFALDGSSIPYVAYTDPTTSGGATVMKFNGSNWVIVGSAGFSAGYARDPSIALDSNGVPYVAYEDYANSNGATVQKFNGLSWTPVGTVGFSAGQVSTPELEINPNGTPYVVYQDNANSNGTTVQKFDGTSWATVGSAAFQGSLQFTPNIEFDGSGNVYLVHKNFSGGPSAYKFAVPTAPEITIKGAGQPLTDGQTATSTADSTDLGSTTTASSITAVYWIHNEGTDDLNISDTAITGTDAAQCILDDLEMKVITPGDSAWLQITYSPSATGTHTATVEITSDDADESPFTFAIGGTATNPTPPSVSSWMPVGPDEFNLPSTGGVGYTSMAIDGSGTPYVVYRDNANSSKATVMEFNGTSWVTVGSAGFSAGEVYYTSMTIDGSGTLYVAYQDAAHGYRTSVQQFDGTSWATVGSAGFSAGSASSPSIAIDGSGTPYVVYEDGGNSGKATVMKFNGTNWVTVGSAGFSAGRARYATIAIEGSGTPNVVYRDYANAGKATVMKFNGTNWVTVGSAGFSAGSAQNISMALDGSGTPYVVYRDNANGDKATVMKFNGTNWVTVGSAGFSAGWLFDTDIAIDGNGTPYVVYRDEANGGKATVMEFDGTSWVTVGSVGFSAGQANDFSMAIDGSGTPYVVYQDAAHGNKATMQQFNGTSWVTVGSSSISAGLANDLSMAIDGSGTPYLAYEDEANSSKATVQQFNGTNWVAVGSAGFSAGEVGYTSIAIDGRGTPYVVYRDIANSSKATVQQFNGTNWVAVGSAGFSPDQVWNTDIAIDGSGTPYVVYTDAANNANVTVMKFNGTSWVTVGSAGFSQGQAWNVDIAIDGSGTPYVAYMDAANSSKATVQQFDGSNWVPVGSVGFSAGQAISISIAIDGSGTPYVVYKDVPNSSKATVQQFDGSSWVTVGSAGFSAGSASSPSIAIDSSGVPYVAYMDAANSSKATVQQFDGSSWVTVGSAGFSAGMASSPSIAVDSSGIPYVAFTNGGAWAYKYGGSTVPSPAPEITLKGAGQNITDGQTATSAADSTDFGMGNMITAVYWIHNEGTGNLNISDTAVTGPDAGQFVLDDLEMKVIPAGDSAFLQVTYSPSAVGTHTATVEITSDDADESPFTFAITGELPLREIAITGNGQPITDGQVATSADDSTDFGTTTLGTPITVSYWIHNYGGDTLFITDTLIQQSGTPAFHIASLESDTIEGGDSSRLQITFDPWAAWPYDAEVQIVNTDADEGTYTFAISAAAQAPPSTNASCPPWYPGGLDSNNAPLRLWLIADSIKASDLDANGLVNVWDDLSCRDNDAAAIPQAPYKPTYVASNPAFNGHASVSFAGSNFMTGTLDSLTEDYTVVAVVRFDHSTQPFNNSDYLITIGNPYSSNSSFAMAREANGTGHTDEYFVYTGNGTKVYGPTLNAQGPMLLHNESTGNDEIWVNNDSKGFNNVTYNATVDGNYMLGSQDIFAFTSYLEGDIAELMVFDDRLTEPARNSLANYLAERYGLGILEDFFSSSVVAPGQYEHWVMGISQQGTTELPTVSSAGMRLSKTGSPNFLQNSGDRIFAGTNMESGTTTSVPGQPSVPMRLEREWYVVKEDQNSNGGKLLLQFDLPMISGENGNWNTGSGSNSPASDYVLLYNDNFTSPNWQRVTVSSKTMKQNGEVVQYILDAANFPSSAAITMGTEDPSNAPVPVELNGLFAYYKAAEEAVWIHWETASEEGSEKFIIERSQDGYAYEAIGEVAAAGWSTSSIRYAAPDRQPFGGINYYRLKTVDLDGSYEYSHVVPVTVPELNRPLQVEVQPNPAAHHGQVEIAAPAAGHYQLTLINHLGQPVMQQALRLRAGKSLHDLDLSRYPAGVYQLMLQNETQQVVRKWVIQR